MKVYSSSLINTGFIILAVVAMSKSGKPMTAEDVMKTFVGNTVVSESPEGTAYDFVQPDGTHIGLHPKHGKLKGSWHVDDEGEACVTWNYPNGAITNCSTVVKKGDNEFEWGDKKLTLESGDVKNLGK